MLEDYGLIQVAGIALIVALLVGRMSSRRASSFFKPRMSKVRKAIPTHLFKKKQAALSATKKCPNCTDSLPISALVCEACEYNFLSGTVGFRSKMLPPPDATPAPEEPKQRLAYRA